MVRKVTILVFILFCKSSIAQQEQNLWWVQTSSNKKYEDSYKNNYSIIEDSVLRAQIIDFINKFIISTDRYKDEMAIEVSSIFSGIRDEKKYNITYISNYYNYIPFQPNINQIAEINGRVILIINENLKEIKVSKKYLFGLLRDRYKDIAEKNRKSYAKDESFIENWLLEHEVPKYVITIKNKCLIDKKIIFE